MWWCVKWSTLGPPFFQKSHIEPRERGEGGSFKRFCLLLIIIYSPPDICTKKKKKVVMNIGYDNTITQHITLGLITYMELISPAKGRGGILCEDIDCT